MKKSLESLKGSKFELSKNELNIQGGRSKGRGRGKRRRIAGPEYSMKYYETNDTNCRGCYDEEVYDMCWAF